MAVLKRTSQYLVHALEVGFFRWGCFVSRYPRSVILGCLLITALCSLGFLNWRSEGRAEKLWIPSDSPYISNKEWLDANFPRNTRYQSALFVSEDNILTPEALIHMLQLHKEVASMKALNRTWNDLCFRIPIADIFLTRRKKRQASARVAEIVPENDVLNVTTSIQVKPKELAVVEAAERSPKLIKSSDLNSQKVAKSQQQQDKPEGEEEYFDPWGYDYENSGKDHQYPDYFEAEEEEGSSDALNDNSDILDELPPNIYCDLVETLNDKCLETSLLELWKYKEDVIRSLTQEDILEAVNEIKESPYFGHKFDFASLLGSITRDEQTGRIIAAKSAFHVWITSVDPSAKLEDSSGTGIELDLADAATLQWEAQLADAILGFDGSKANMTALANVARSFGDISSSAIFFDGVKMVVGYLLMFIYTFLFLGRVNMVEHRFFLTAAGIFAVAMGLVISMGLTFMFNLPYTPMHAILPFLCLGIGIDDMFVIVQCWYNLKEDESYGKTVHEKIGLTMRHAGVAITVTSLTDVFAFGIGSVTILPGLQAFCASCAIGIGAIYLLQASWFVAWLSLDQQRIERKLDGLLPCCVVHKNFEPNGSGLNKEDLSRKCLNFCANLVRFKAFKVTVMSVTLVFVCVGTWGTLLIRQHFDPVLLLPADSYLRQWISVHDEQFPQDGWVADIYTGKLDPFVDLEKIDRLVSELDVMAGQKTVLKGVDAWWTNFKAYLVEEKNVSDWRTTLAEDPFDDDNNTSTATPRSTKFAALLSDFLYSRQGAKYKRDFHFDGNLTCNYPAPRITATKFSITYLPFSGSEEHIPGRRAVTELIEKANISSRTFSFSKVYAAWETDEVIAFELWRNLGLAMICVFIITLILLANIQICLMVLVCVLLTLVDMVGMLHFWGITVDTLSCINIVLAIGLCVDYSAHIAHAFIVSQGTREDRAVYSLSSMGPAIINGGITTFLALVLLGFSQSHVFITFFKVFLLTVVFGLFHGVVFFPVLLSWIGPLEGHKREDPTTSMNFESEGGVAAKSGGLPNPGFVTDNPFSLVKTSGGSGSSSSTNSTSGVESCSSSTRTLIVPVKSVIMKTVGKRSTTSSPDETIMSVTHGKFTAVHSDLSQLDSLSLSSQEFDIFTSNNNLRQAATEYFGLNQNNNKGSPRLPELRKDDVLVKPMPAENNWILLPSAADERWRQSRVPNNESLSSSFNDVAVVPLGNPTEISEEVEESSFWRRGITSLLRFMGPKS